MPRVKSAHHNEVKCLPFDPETPFERRVALYSRLSDDDEESVSHDVQDDDGLEWCRQHNMVPVKIYRDWRTGTDPNRIAWRRMFEDAHKGEHSGVVFYDHTRFHRGLYGAYPVALFHRELPTYRFAATAGPYDIDQVALLGYMSGQEIENTRRRSMSQRAERTRRGQWVAGKKPYWLEREPKTRLPYVVAERAGYVLEALDRYARGERLGTIAQWLTASAPPAPGRTDMWTTARVRGVFRNPALWGRLDYGRVKVETERRNGEVFVTGRSVNPDAIPLAVPPLIHATDLERAECMATGGCERDAHITGGALNVLIASNNLNHSGRVGRTVHPLRRRVVCACGWRMGFRAKTYKAIVRDYGYLMCVRQHQRGISVAADVPDCPNDGISTRTLWPAVRALFVAAVHQPDAVIAAVEADILSAAAQEARTAAEDAAILADATLALEELLAREETLYTDWRGGDISKGVYDRQRSLIAHKRMEYEETKRRVLDRRRILETAASATQSLRVGLAEAAELPLDELTWEHWTGLFERLVQDVVLDVEGAPSLRWRRS